MIPEESKAKIREVLFHKPFLCDKVLLFEMKDANPIPCDEESDQFFQVYRERIAAAADAKSGYWYGNIIGAADGRVWGGKYYAGSMIGSVLVIIAKAVEHVEPNGQSPPPIDTYFLDAVSHRVCQILGVPCDLEANFSVSEVTSEGEQVFSELRSLEECEGLWRSEYGDDQWLAVKDGTVKGHSKDRVELEAFVRNNQIKPPVLYVPPKGQEMKADILSIKGTGGL